MARLRFPTPVRFDPYPAASGALVLDLSNGAAQEIHKMVHEGVRKGLPLREGGVLTEEAEKILRDALARYRRPDGYEGRLVEAAWQLEQIGWESWPVLRDVIQFAIPECEYFLGAAVRLHGVPQQQRLSALLAAARNPDANVRSRLLELLEVVPGDLLKEVLRELTAKGSPDDSVTDRAQEAWNEQLS